MTSAADVNADLSPALPDYKSPELQYSVVNFVHSQPRAHYVYPEGNITTATIPNSSDHETKFPIPKGCYNFGKSVIRYDAACTQALIALSNFWKRADMIPFISIQLRTAEGQLPVAQIMGADHYSRIVNKAETPFTDFVTNGSLAPLYPCNVEDSKNYIGDGALSGGTRSFLEPRYYQCGDDGDAAQADPMSRAIKLENFKNSFIGMDKMVYFPEPMELVIRWQHANHWFFSAVTLTGVSTEATGTVALSNIALVMQKESNKDIIAELTASVMQPPGGVPFALHVPDVTHIKMAGASGANVSVSLRLGSTHGKRITKIYAIPQNATESKHTRYDSNNVAAAKITRFQTLIDGNPIQPNAIPVDANVWGDWYLLEDKLKGTAILDQEVYRRNWFICDDFSGITEKNKLPSGEYNVVTGHPVEVGSIYELVTDNAQNVQWYFYIIGQKTLRIAPPHLGGIAFV